MNQSDFMYVYDEKLFKYLKSKGIRYITTGLNPTSLRQFWQYSQNDEFTNTLNEFIPQSEK